MVRKKKSRVPSLLDRLDNNKAFLEGGSCEPSVHVNHQHPTMETTTSNRNSLLSPFSYSSLKSSCTFVMPIFIVVTTTTLLLISGVTSSPASSLSTQTSSSSVTNHHSPPSAQQQTFFNHDHEVFDEESFPHVSTVFSTTNPAINFTHLTMDSETGRVYVGATNWIYQLNNNLSLESGVKTGPVDDSPNCSPTDCQEVDSSLLRVTKNTNKILVIDPSSRMLIVCGSVHQGSCRRHSLSDVRSVEPLVGVPVAANDENSSTIAFVAPARYGLSSSSQTSSVLYVAASNSKIGPYRDVVPAISSRSLESGSKLFSIIEKSFTDTARVDIEYHLRDYFLVKYITGFSTKDFVYFATVQRKSPFRALEEWGYISRLARVCASDAGYHTYTEMTISCIGPDGTDYNLLQDATVVKTGSVFSRSLGIRENDHVLIGTFAASKDHSMVASSRSAVCVFPLAEIERGFLENIQMCYNGSIQSRNMDYIAGSVNECPEPRRTFSAKTVKTDINFCNEAVKVNGSVALIVSPAITYNNATMTGVTVSVSGQHTIALVGTSSGSLKKILMTSAVEAEEFEDVVIDSGRPILEDILIDSKNKYVYVASPYRVSIVLFRIWHCLWFKKTNLYYSLTQRLPKSESSPHVIEKPTAPHVLHLGIHFVEHLMIVHHCLQYNNIREHHQSRCIAGKTVLNIEPVNLVLLPHVIGVSTKVSVTITLPLVQQPVPSSEDLNTVQQRLVHQSNQCKKQSWSLMELEERSPSTSGTWFPLHFLLHRHLRNWHSHTFCPETPIKCLQLD